MYYTYLPGWHCVIPITVPTRCSNCFKFQAESWRDLRNGLVFTFESLAVISFRKLKIGWIWGARVKVNKVINMIEGMCTSMGSCRPCTINNSTHYCWILPSCFPVGHREIVIQIIRTVVVDNLSSPVIASKTKKENRSIYTISVEDLFIVFRRSGVPCFSTSHRERRRQLFSQATLFRTTKCPTEAEKIKYAKLSY